jgi:hypothetical protein
MSTQPRSRLSAEKVWISSRVSRAMRCWYSQASNWARACMTPKASCCACRISSMPTIFSPNLRGSPFCVS